MKTKKQKEPVKHNAVTVYVSPSSEWKKNFYLEAKHFGLSGSAYASLCITTGRRIITSNFDMKKMPSK